MLDPTSELDRLRAADLYRRRRVLTGPQQVWPVIDGRRLLSFCSNDYLGLANHPALITALQEGAARYGVGSGAAHLVSGHSEAHEALEAALAEFTGRPRALLFSTGYMANLGVVSALVGHGDLILADRLNHASLTDGARLSGARLRRYPHRELDRLRRLLNAGAPDAPDRSVLIATDGVFSMDGDLAPLPELARMAQARGAWLLVDDAHGLGVLGASGRGTLEHFGLGIAEVPLLVGTLSKAFGNFGAFVAGNEALIELLIQRARSYIYTTALPPALAHAALAALSLARCEGWRRAYLATLVQRFRTGAAGLGLRLLDSPTPIQPILAGDSRTALAWSQWLEAQGILVTAIRPPTVPEGSARLRITLCAEHQLADVDRLLEVLARLPRPESLPQIGPTESPHRSVTPACP